jgi:hypothetical protein
MSLFNESTGKFNYLGLKKLSTYDLNHTYNIFGYTPLIQAINMRDTDLINELINRGADPNCPRKQLEGDADPRLYPLEYAANNDKIFNLLTERGARKCSHAVLFEMRIEHM